MNTFNFKNFENNKIFISHGATDVDMNQKNSHFQCPNNIRIILFDHPGQAFRKLDAGFIINWIISNLRSDNNWNGLQNTILNIPLINAFKYHIKIFEKNELVPNIKLYVQDENVQCGLFNMIKKDSSNKINYFKVNINPGGEIWMNEVPTNEYKDKDMIKIKIKIKINIKI